MRILETLFVLISDVHATPCQAAKFIAKEKAWKYLTSPYFPDTIHAKTQCEWEIAAPKGKRVKERSFKFDCLIYFVF
jgi:hypothetical protein